jgi:hypothetical protein
MNNEYEKQMPDGFLWPSISGVVSGNKNKFLSVEWYGRHYKQAIRYQNSALNWVVFNSIRML